MCVSMSRPRSIHVISMTSIICSYLTQFVSPSSKNKKNLFKKVIFSYIFLYFGKWNFLAQILKNFLYFLIFPEKVTPKTNFVFLKMKLSGSNIKKFLIFSQKKAFLIFQKKNTQTKFLLFQETKLSYISGNFLYFRK